jgi:RNA polymerase sigma-70 factor (ECF subfamily)
MPTREETALAARAGDTAAFRLLIEQSGPSALRVAELILGSRPEAEDALQDACLRAWRDLPKLREANKWDAWFRKLTVRAAIDRTRRRPRLTAIPMLDTDVDVGGDADFTRGVGEADELRWLLAALSAEERALVVLRYGSDLEVPDAAALLGIPLGTAKSRLHRAIGRLRARAEGAA